MLKKKEVPWYASHRIRLQDNFVNWRHYHTCRLHWNTFCDCMYFTNLGPSPQRRLPSWDSKPSQVVSKPL